MRDPSKTTQTFVSHFAGLRSRGSAVRAAYWQVMLPTEDVGELDDSGILHFFKFVLNETRGNNDECN